jgi:FMN phosphatase YigB (HAD superfamily)
MVTPPLRAVCLDAYGTLVRISDRRGPYHSLFGLLGVDPRQGARSAMTADLGIEELVSELTPGSEIDLSPIVRDLEAEVNSVRLFGDVPDALARLRGLGLKLWVASNLAPPYAVPLRSLLAELVDGFCFSFAVGAVKPEPAFFARLCGGIGCEPGMALMVGDSIRSDVEGARTFGVRAIRLNRDAAEVSPGVVRSLTELADLLEAGTLRFGG